jgi:hypothetical protein
MRSAKASTSTRRPGLDEEAEAAKLRRQFRHRQDRLLSAFTRGSRARRHGSAHPSPRDDPRRQPAVSNHASGLRLSGSRSIHRRGGRAASRRRGRRASETMDFDRASRAGAQRSRATHIPDPNEPSGGAGVGPPPFGNIARRRMRSSPFSSLRSSSPPAFRRIEPVIPDFAPASPRRRPARPPAARGGR